MLTIGKDIVIFQRYHAIADYNTFQNFSTLACQENRSVVAGLISTSLFEVRRYVRSPPFQRYLFGFVSMNFSLGFDATSLARPFGIFEDIPAGNESLDGLVFWSNFWVPSLVIATSVIDWYG